MKTKIWKNDGIRNLMISAKECLIKGDTKTAAEQLNRGIAHLGQLTLDGYHGTECWIEGASIDRWKERFWYELEENGLLED